MKKPYVIPKPSLLINVPIGIYVEDMEELGKYFDTNDSDDLKIIKYIAEIICERYQHIFDNTSVERLLSRILTKLVLECVECGDRINDVGFFINYEGIIETECMSYDKSVLKDYVDMAYDEDCDITDFLDEE